MRIIAVLALGLMFTGMLSAAQAGNARSFVSGRGSDSAACTLAAPCRTFAAAYTKTNAGGEITILDPAGYGPLNITTALSVINDGVGEAGIFSVAAGDAITINAGTNDTITLRGLSIDGTGAGTNGIKFNTGAALTVANCVIRHFTGVGIYFAPNASSNLTVSNTMVLDNGDTGIQILPTGSGVVTGLLNRVELNNNQQQGLVLNGTLSTGTVKATAVDSIATGAGNGGFYVFTSVSQAPTTLMLLRSVAANNSGAGLVALGIGSTIRTFQSMVTGNGQGWITNQGVVKSYGNNAIDGNFAAEGAPSGIAQK